MALENKSFYFGPKILQHECLKTAVFGVFNVDKNIIRPLKVFSCHKDQILPLQSLTYDKLNTVYLLPCITDALYFELERKRNNAFQFED